LESSVTLVQISATLPAGAEEEAVIAKPEAEFAGVIALQGFDVTLARNGKAKRPSNGAAGDV